MTTNQELEVYKMAVKDAIKRSGLDPDKFTDEQITQAAKESIIERDLPSPFKTAYHIWHLPWHLLYIGALYLAIRIVWMYTFLYVSIKNLLKRNNDNW
jgi:hypothetical protein